MEISYLREYIVLASTLHFQQAASMLHINPSSLTRHIQSLEDELGVTLLRRNKHTVELTTEGYIFRQHAEQTLASYDSFFYELKDIDEHAEKSIEIGIPEFHDEESLANLVLAFNKQHPESTLNFSPCPTRALFDRLRSGDLDLAFIHRLNSDEKGLNNQAFAEDEVVLHVPEGNFLYDRDVIEIAALHNQKIYMRYGPTSGLYRYIKNCFSQLGIQATFKSLEGNWMPDDRRSLCLSPMTQADSIYHDGPFRLIRLNPGIKLQLGIRTLKNVNLRANVIEFIKFCQSWSS